MTDNSKRLIGIPWIEPEDYDVCRSIMADGHEMPYTYARFLELAEFGEKFLIAQGHPFVRVTIHPKQFSAWCKSRGLNVDSAARTLFIEEAIESGKLG